MLGGSDFVREWEGEGEKNFQMESPQWMGFIGGEFDACGGVQKAYQEKKACGMIVWAMI